MCDFYAGAFERLIRVCVARYAGVLEGECMSKGDTHSRFVLEGVT
jgi:predicted hydrocarbon binding protein